MAGSETTVHAAMRAMIARGHEVDVIADQTPESYEFEGVHVHALPRNGQHERAKEIATGADLLITHLDCTSQAMTLALNTATPLVHFVHNHLQLGFWRVDPRVKYRAALIVFNSDWIAKAEKLKFKAQERPWPGPQMTMHPVVEPDQYRCERGTKITLCNPTHGKGAETIYKLSESMPDYEFLTVAGIYGEQISPPHLGDEWVNAHPNVEHMQNNPDMREVLRKTKILLMPSNYESYGRCAVEAACAGIPSIVHPTEGLLESLGEAGIFVDRDDIEGYRKEIERLYSDEVYYRKRSDLALKLAESLDPESEFDRLEDALIQTAGGAQRKEGAMAIKVSTERLWKLKNGRIVPEVGGRIPQDAAQLHVGIGGEVDEDEIMRANGELEALPPESTLMHSKMMTPAENKAVEAPEETKSKKTRKTKVA